MKLLYKFLAVLAVPAILLTYSFSGGSPGGYTGSTLDGVNCTDCHAGVTNNASGWITTDIPAEGYTPGETYTITAIGTHDGVEKFGFELTAEDAMGKSGMFAISDADRTKLTNSNAAVTHTAMGTTVSGNTNTWTMNWTAPAAGHGNVTFFGAFNAANGNGNNNGDVIYVSNSEFIENVPAPAVTSVDPDHAEQGQTLSITITGENTTWTSGVFNVVFRHHDDDTETFMATNIDVKSDTELTADIMIPVDHMSGLHDVSVDGAVLENGFNVDVASSVGDELLAASVSIYPNPASNYIVLELPESAQFSIIDISGRQIYSKKDVSTSERVDVSGLESGIYFVQILHNGHAASKRVLVN